MAAGPPARARGRLERSLTWLTGGALALDLVLIGGLVALIAGLGLGTFWQKPLALYELEGGERLLAEVHGREPERVGLPASLRLRIANRELTGLDFRQVELPSIRSVEHPPDALWIERSEWGSFHGWPRALRAAGSTLAEGAEVLPELRPLLERKALERREIVALERGDLARESREIERLRLERRVVELRARSAGARSERLAAIAEREAQARERYQALALRLQELRARFAREELIVTTAAGDEHPILVSNILRVLEPNRMSALDKAGLYARRLYEFVATEPRESNTEGGIFPAIFGTVLMVTLMSIAVVPFGVLAAIYMHEYARQGFLLRLVRISVNNLAGVPSIVFGIFGLGFFVYGLGGALDELFFPEALPTPTFGTGGILWASLTLALLTVPVVIVSTEEGLAAVPRAQREGSLALGATRFETIARIVLPASTPGILTGLILAMARAAGEVAPLMIVGMVKLAPSLPVDGSFPFLHLERKFMHLGFHIYDLGFQSPNVEAVEPLVFATALLLIVIVLATNLTAIVLRNRLRQRHAARAL
jgi:phosphate transport system permease protein